METSTSVRARAELGWRGATPKNGLRTKLRRLRFVLLALLSASAVHASAPTDPLISTIAGGGSILGDGGAATSAMLTKPVSVAIDAAGNLYIADKLARRVRKVTPAGVISTAAGGGAGADTDEPVPATSVGVLADVVEVDSVGNLYIAEGNRVRKVSTGGLISTVAGTGVSGYGGDGGPATSAQLHGVADIALDRQGNLYIADSFNNRVRKVSNAGIITTIAGIGSPFISSCSCRGDGGEAILAAVWDPQGLALDAGGNLHIVQRNGVLRRIDSSGMIDTVTGGGSVFGADPMPTDVALYWKDIVFDRRGNAYFTQNNLIIMLTVHGSLHVLAGAIDEPTGGFYGLDGFTGDGGPAKQAMLNQPLGIALDSQDNLIIADSANKRIRKISTVVQPIEPPGTYMFRSPQEVPTLSSFSHKDVVSGDVNGDGRDDIVFSTSADLDMIVPYEKEFYGLGILLQDANGGLADPIYLYRDWPATTPSPVMERGGLVLADFNGDGVKDIVVSHGAGLEIVPGSRAGIFAARPFSSGNAAPAHELVAMDVNGDGHTDVVAHSTGSATDFSKGLGVYFGNGQGEVSARTFMPVAFPVVGLSSGDLNGDGLKDIVVGFTESPGEADAGGIAVFLGNGFNGFATPRKYDSIDRGSNGVTVGDFNADGRSDVIVGPRQFINITNLSVFSQTATGQLLPPVALRTAVTPDAMLAADVNADGRDDLLVAHISTWALGYYQQGPSGLSAEVKYSIPPLEHNQTSSIASGDVNHDGYKDAITLRVGTALVILYGTGKREGIRTNGGQPLVNTGMGGSAPQVYQPASAVRENAAVLKPRVGRVSIGERWLGAAMQWARPLRENTIVMGLRFWLTTLAENVAPALSRPQVFAGQAETPLPSVLAVPAQQRSPAMLQAGNGSKRIARSLGVRTTHLSACMGTP